MPSPRVSQFEDESQGATVLDAELMPTGRHTRDLPPASLELRAPSDVAERSDARRRHAHPGRIGRPSADQQDQTIHEVFEGMRKGLEVTDIAANAGCGQDGRKVREIMATARETLQRRVEDYVEIHVVAAKVAAMKGNAEPAQWALENIAVEGVRVVDPPQKHVQQTAPTFNLGFMIGGMPQRVALPPASDDK